MANLRSECTCEFEYSSGPLFRCSKTIDFSTRLWGITTEFVGFIPQNLVLRSITLGWILIIYWNWSIACHAIFPLQQTPDPMKQMTAMTPMVRWSPVVLFLDKEEGWCCLFQHTSLRKKIICSIEPLGLCLYRRLIILWRFFNCKTWQNVPVFFCCFPSYLLSCFLPPLVSCRLASPYTHKFMPPFLYTILHWQSVI